MTDLVILIGFLGVLISLTLVTVEMLKKNSGPPAYRPPQTYRLPPEQPYVSPNSMHYLPQRDRVIIARPMVKKVVHHVYIHVGDTPLQVVYEIKEQLGVSDQEALWMMSKQLIQLNASRLVQLPAQEDEY